MCCLLRFPGYLHAGSLRSHDGTSKFDSIVRKLKEELTQYPDYEIFISGHSLGGALRQLLAFELASLEDDTIPKPIRAISFASPQVGNKDYAAAFAALERAGRIRHLRVTNQGDLVPELPFGFGYSQTGINVHVNKSKKAKIGYGAVKNVLSQASLHSGDMHSLRVYNERLFNDLNADILSLTIDQLYQKEAGIAFPSEQKSVQTKCTIGSS